MAITVYRATDRIKIQIGEATLIVKPLSYKDKNDWLTCITSSSGTQLENALKGLAILMRATIKEIDGVIFTDGEKFSLEFDENGKLTEDSVDTLLNMEIFGDIRDLMIALTRGVPKDMRDNAGNILEHIKIIPLAAQPKKKLD